MQYDVFISYSRKDTAMADRITAAFDRAGIRYFIDRQGIGGGFEFPVVLAEAILESQVILFLGSKNSYESKFTNAELTFAFNEKPKNSILPYIIDGSTMPPALRFVFSSINWRTLESHPIEPALVDDVLNMLGRERRDAQAEAERAAREQSEKERQARERAEAERRTKEQAERDRKEREERAVREKTERERLAKEAAEAERLAREKATEERLAREKQERQFRLNGRGHFGMFRVGDYYDDGQKEGVVFEVDSTGHHGKIVSLQETTKVWAADKNFGSLFRSDNPCKQWLGLKDREDGRRNLQRIMQVDNWKKRYPAIGFCAEMGTEWYLPAVAELKQLAESAIYDAVNSTLSEKRGQRLLAGRDFWYWSSTEGDDATSGYLCVQCVRMIVGNVDDDFAYNSGYVRAVATF